MNEQVEALTRRVLALERQARRRRLSAAVALVGAAGAGAVFGQGRSAAPAEIQALRFALVNGEGARLAVLEATPEGAPRLTLRARDGAVRLGLGLDANGAPSVVLADAAGQEQVTLKAAPDGSRVSVMGLGKTAVSLANDGAAPRVAITDRDGKDRLWLAVRLGSPVLQFLDARGVARTGLSTFNDDTGLAVISETDRSNPGLVLLGKNRSVVWSAP